MPHLVHPDVELSVVMPVFNEEGTVEQVVRDWVEQLERLGIRYQFLAYDDGSRDRTGSILQALAADIPGLVVRTHPNRGHGPTILRGYREAEGTWVLQVDSDGEVSPRDLEKMWRARQGFDLVIGYRWNRKSPWPRRVVSLASRLTVRLFFGGYFRDVNCPYRLIRRSCLKTLLPYLDPSTFAPNVILCGLAARLGFKIRQIPVTYRGRSSGSTSLVQWKLWRVALRSWKETIRTAYRLRGNIWL